MPVDVLPLSPSFRSKLVAEAFHGTFNKKPNFYVRVPGRVNLIGEHIDYCGYGVCPMALKQDMFLAVSTHESPELILHNVDTKYPAFECNINSIRITLSGTTPDWYQYFLCGLKGIVEYLEAKQQEQQIQGLQVVVSGTVPQSAGLSSSSALVSAAALAAMHAYKLSLTKEELADLCAKSERYIGTQGGGMDQAIAFLAREGRAKLIEFEPLRSSDVELPRGAVFVIAHSLSNLNKAATGDFNCRVVECRLAAQIIAKKQGLDWTKFRRLGEVQKALGLSLEEMILLTKRSLKFSPYSKDEVVNELGTTIVELEDVSFTPNTKDIEQFKLYQRAYHVFNEANRVEQFHKICKDATGGEDALVTLGRLMSESHQSLKDLYECSHPQLDRIVELARDFTLGTRLTGAGWGGCTVSLVTPEKVPDFVQFLTENFYKPLGVTDNFDSVLFTSAPEGGACVYL